MKALSLHRPLLFLTASAASLILTFSLPCAAAAEGASPKAPIRHRLSRDGRAVVAVALRGGEGRIKGTLEEHNRRVALLQEELLEGISPSTTRLLRRFRSVAGLSLEIHDEEGLRLLLSRPEILRVDLDVGGSGRLDQSRPRVGAEDAHSLGFTGRGGTVAILDSGADTDHPDLASDLLHEECFCFNPSFPNDGCCPGDRDAASGPGSAEDDQGHGTHVAGIVTGGGVSSPLGISPDSPFVAVKVLDRNNSFYSSSDITAALDWVLNNRPDVDAVSMSLATFTTFNDYCDIAAAWAMNMAAAIDNLHTRGVLSVAAAGNSGLSGPLPAPACIENTLAVGATSDSSDDVAPFSNGGAMVDIFAPGANITAARRGGGSVTMSGTSMSTPHTAAAVAVLRQKDPFLTAEQIEAALAASPFSATHPGSGVTRPRLDLPSALASFADAPLALLEPDTGLDLPVAPTFAWTAGDMDGYLLFALLRLDTPVYAGYYPFLIPIDTLFLETPALLARYFAGGSPPHVWAVFGYDAGAGSWHRTDFRTFTRNWP